MKCMMGREIVEIETLIKFSQGCNMNGYRAYQVNNSLSTHFVDIDEVENEEDEDGITEMPEKTELSNNKNVNRPVKLREFKRPYKSISRQVSLETGFSVINKEKGGDKRVLARSGRSLGAGQRAGGSGEIKKGDFSKFMTKSSLSKQNSLTPMKKERAGADQFSQDDRAEDPDESVNRSVPAGRYFAALRGPELDEVKDSEDILLPKDEKWPFLLRFPIGCFGICLGLSSQAILWRSLATSSATKFLHIPPYINLVIWLLAVSILILVSITYILKFIFYFEAVRREYFHPVRVNFFFAPWVVCMFLALSAPPMLFPNPLHPAIWCAFMIPYFILELKIYGQWLSGGKRRLCKVANPSSHLSVVGNFVGAILASKVGWQEPAKFLWAVGFAHYLVLFVTLYQRLPTSEALPKELHPVYSMFIAAPSAASLAWEAIYGEFDGMSRNCYFTALFLYISLVVRISFFWGFRFSLAWWSYTFPMTTVSIATIKYAEHVPSGLSKGLALSLSAMSSTMVSVLLICTLLHGFVWQTLFPNDLAIAITEKKHNIRDKKLIKKPYDIRRWAKQSPVPFISNAVKEPKETDQDNQKVTTA